jgi:hypothetical protein
MVTKQTPVEAPPELQTISETTQLLRCSERHIRRQIKAPGLVRIGMRVYRINRTKLLAGES